MAKRGVTCSVCARKDAPKIDADIVAAVLSFAELSEKYGIAVHTLKLHKQNHVRPRLLEAVQAMHPEAPPMPVLVGLSPKDRAAAHCDWLQARIKWAQEAKVGEKEVAQLAGQYTNATRLLAKLSGALDVTETQIVRSAPWARLMVIVRDALRDHPEALRAVSAAVDAYESGEK